MNKKGYTLIEVIVSIMILSIASLMLAGTFGTVIHFMSKSNDVKNASDAMYSYIEGTEDSSIRSKVHAVIPSDVDKSYHIISGGNTIEVSGIFNQYYVDNDSEIHLSNLMNNKNLKVIDSPNYKTIEAFAKELYSTSKEYEKNKEYCKDYGDFGNICDLSGYNNTDVLKYLYDNKNFNEYPNELLPSSLKGKKLYISAFYPWELFDTATFFVNHGGVLIYLGEKRVEMPANNSTFLVNVIYDYDDNIWYYNSTDFISLKYSYSNVMEPNLCINGECSLYKSWDEFKISITDKNSNWMKLDTAKIYIPNDDYWVPVNTKD